MGESPFRLAVCAEMVFTDLPFIERVRRIRDAGFAVEIWSWGDKELAQLRATGADFTSMTGYVEGSLVDPDGIALLLRTAEQSLRARDALGGTPNLNLHGTGLDLQGLPVVPRHEATGAMWLAARDTLASIAALGRQEGAVFCLENLNTLVDHPGVPFAKADDTLSLVRAVGDPHLRMNLDLYHAQIGEGNLIELVRRSAPYLGEVQVADVPGRCEPGTGEIRYEAVAGALQETGYDGVVGLEAWASGDSESALRRFRSVFGG